MAAQAVRWSGIPLEACSSQLLQQVLRFAGRVHTVQYVELVDVVCHTRGGGLAYLWTRVRATVAAASLAIYWRRLHHAIRGAQGVLPMTVDGATSQLDVPSLTPLSVAGCGRLQLGVPHLSYFSRSRQVVDN